jgi:beta-1,2-mannobiose phosphorylase / 1,2-beta-oligomannan phosphorylase
MNRLGRIIGGGRLLWIGLSVAVFWIGLSAAVFAQHEFPAELVDFQAHPANPLFEAAGEGNWDAQIRERGWILFDPEAPEGQPAWRMWYTGYDGTREGLKQLGLATSRDGIHWERHPENPLSGPHWVEDMIVVPHEGTLYMFAEGREDQAHLLTSRDGIAWDRVGPLDIRRTDGEPIEPGPYGTPTAWHEEGTWYLLYERRDEGIWLATSSDLAIWRHVQDEPVMVPGPDQFEQDLIALNQVIKYQGHYYAYYHGSQAGSRLWAPAIAVSKDLRTWEKYSANPLIPREENKSSGIVVHDGQQFRFYTMHDQVDLYLPRNADSTALDSTALDSTALDSTALDNTVPDSTAPAGTAPGNTATTDGHPLDIENLVAWCIVPFDIRRRGPAERAEMVRRLGLRRVAYDWREEHVATFEEEILEYQKRDIEFFAFWSWHDALEPLLAQYDIRPQIWQIMPNPDLENQEERVRAAAEAMLPLVEKTRRLGLKLGLYNHGGWGGEPENLVAVCEYLRREHDAGHVGIAYNFHHAHDRIADFESALPLMVPYLLCLNLNGMNDNAQPKILAVGQGRHDLEMLQTVLASGYKGPIGIIGHQETRDVEECLRENLEGLAKLRELIQPKDAE